MKQILTMIIVVLMVIPTVAQAQELTNREERQLKKQLRKEQQAEESAQKAKVVAMMVEFHRFVLEADQLRDRRGNTVNVTSMINFVACDSVQGVIQVGSQQYVGMNGVGGITVDGPVTGYEYSYNEKSSSYMVSYIVRTSTGSYDVQMSVSREGRADATISSSWPGKLSYSGYLVPPSASRVYKGTSF